LVIGAAVTNSKTIEALGSGAALVIAKVAVTDTHSGVILASGTGAHVDLDSSTVSGGMVEAIAGGELRLSGAAIGSGTLVETASGGTAILSGAISNSGALFASGIHSLIDLVSGATVTGGGSVEVGNGAVQIAGAGSEAVNFLSSGAGGLLLNGATSYTGNVSNFGAGISAHSDHSEYIELTAVTYSSGVVSETYSGGTSGGVLTVTSGATTVATISMIGSYVTSDFKLAAGSGGSGTVITDPATVHSANITLFGSYIAGSFVTAGGQGGSAISNTAQGEQPMLTHPHA
jgi:hypothetical protein